MSYKIEKDLIKGLHQQPLNAFKIIVAHEAGNPNNTGSDSLENEINYMKGNFNQPPAYAYTSHFVGGGGRIVQLTETGKRQNGAGYTANGIAYAQVELARTDNKETFKKDYDSYVWLLRCLAKEANLPLTFDSSSDNGIKSHNWVRKNLGGTTHTDPFAYLASFGISESQFEHDVENGAVNEHVMVTHDDNTHDENASSHSISNSIVDYLKSIGVDASFANRSELADKYGISGYKGTAEQNAQLLNKMRSGSKPKPKPSQKTSGYTGGSIVDYLKSIGESSSFANRNRLAGRHGISGYKGTAEQNAQLLNKMRSGSKPKPEPSHKTSGYTGDSIVDYLKSIGESSSFGNRNRIAGRHGISGYKGTAEQNAQLLNKMRV